MSIDGTDVRIYETYLFDSKWYSHKFHGPGLRYEVGVLVSSGHNCWINGPFPCSEYRDNAIFKEELKGKLLLFEKVIADKGYMNESVLCVSNLSEREKRIVSKLGDMKLSMAGLNDFKFFVGHLGMIYLCIGSVFMLLEI